MKTAILPQLRVEPGFRNAVESVLHEGENLSAFIEAAVRGAVEYRRTQMAFHARGELAWQEYQRAGASCPADRVVGELRDVLEAKRQQLPSRAATAK
ncbi:MAG: prevent-host-death protein [Azonexus sp.]|nr:prevent-host-death protein [Azonexus sp.]